jgi:hypothetical protein
LALVFYEFDCKNNQLRALAGKEYLGADDVDDVRPERFRAAKPESSDELILNAICKEVR